MINYSTDFPKKFDLIIRNRESGELMLYENCDVFKISIESSLNQDYTYLDNPRRMIKCEQYYKGILSFKCTHIEGEVSKVEILKILDSYKDNK